MASGTKQTLLFEMHIGRGAKMAPVGGWNLPLHYYEGIADEQKHARECASVFDHCYVGKFRVAGAGAAAVLDGLLACPVLDQPAGTCRTNFLLNSQGGVQEELLVCAMAGEDFFLISYGTHPATAASVLANALPEGVAMQDLSELLAKIDLLGPESAAVLQDLDVPEEVTLQEDFCRSAKIADIPCILIGRDRLGGMGFELCCAADYAEDLWEILLETDGVLPGGQGAWEALRIEAGIPRVGSDLLPGHSLLQTSLAPLLQLEGLPERSFAGKEALTALAGDRKLVQLRLEGRRAPRPGSPVLAGETEVGTVTSGAFAASAGRTYALAWVDQALAVPETLLAVSAGDVTLSCQVSLPELDDPA